ncbi:glycoside hydrolase family 28 protein, partial [Alishewanella sp. SMS9]|nr:glycoside hydrolase family 28 protein [Alishewanella sp. SMS9]
MTDLIKRDSVKTLGLLSAGLSLLSISGCQILPSLSQDNMPANPKDVEDLAQWRQADSIIKSIKPTEFA